MINLNSVAIAVREIFTGVRIFKSKSSKLGQIPFDLVFLFAIKTNPRRLLRTPNLKSLGLAVQKISKPVC